MPIDDKLKGKAPFGTVPRIDKPNKLHDLPVAFGLAQEYGGDVKSPYNIVWIEDQEETIILGQSACELLGYQLSIVMPDNSLTTPDGFARELYKSTLEDNLIILDLHYEAAKRGSGPAYSGRDIFLAGQKAISQNLANKDNLKFLIATSMEKEFDWAEYSFGEGQVYGWKKVNHEFGNSFAKVVDQVIKGEYQNRLN